MGLSLLLLAQSVAAGPWSGSLSTELQSFTRTSDDPDQYRNYLSFALAPEYSTRWQDGAQQLDVELFARGGSRDTARNHGDVRVLSWSLAAPSWELRAGMRQVFWGVTESQHLVDIVNQTDLVEGLDGEEKLGQAMINLALIGDWGTLDAMVLPGFRQRTFPGAAGRPDYGLPVDTDNPRYEAGDDDRHIDYALRWYHSIAAWDIGLSYFTGTGREPELLPIADASGVHLIPYYALMTQTGLDLQATYNSWLWKLESVYRTGNTPDYWALTAGFEYSFTDIRSSGVDLGIVVEYLYDDRGDAATTAFADDIMLGLRLALNDVQSTDALLGIIVDNEGKGKMIALEAGRRLGDSWKLSFDSYIFAGAKPSDQLYSFRDDDYVQLNLAYHW